MVWLIAHSKLQAAFSKSRNAHQNLGSVISEIMICATENHSRTSAGRWFRVRAELLQLDVCVRTYRQRGGEIKCFHRTAFSRS